MVSRLERLENGWPRSANRYFIAWNAVCVPNMSEITDTIQWWEFGLRVMVWRIPTGRR